MKAPKIVRFVNLLLAGTLAAVHPALEELDPAERMRAEQFIIGMRLPLHKDPATFDRGVKRTRSTGIAHNVPTVWSD